MLYRLLLVILPFARQFVADEHKLHATLFKTYVKSIRPVRNSSDRTHVRISSLVLSIVKLDERNQQLTLNQRFDLAWNDDYLGWEGTEFDPIQSITVASDLVWIPDLVLINAHKIISNLPENQRYVRINRNGIVEMSDAQMITFGCQFAVEDFPFDSQLCTLEYGPWLHDNSSMSVDVYADYERQSLQYLQNNPEWKALSYRAERKMVTLVADNGKTTFYENVYFYISLERRPFYFLLSFVAPSFAITSVCLVGLFTPSNSEGLREEKVTLGLTTLLTMSVILNIVTNAMPRSGTGMPKLGSFIMTEMVVAACGTLITVVIMLLHERALTREWSVPAALQRTRKKQQKSGAKKELTPQHLTQLRTMSANAHFAQLKDLTQAIVGCYQSMEAIRALIEARIEAEDLEEKWTQFFDNVDLMMLLLFFFTNVALSVNALQGVG